MMEAVHPIHQLRKEMETQTQLYEKYTKERKEKHQSFQQLQTDLQIVFWRRMREGTEQLITTINTEKEEYNKVLTEYNTKKKEKDEYQSRLNALQQSVSIDGLFFPVDAETHAGHQGNRILSECHSKQTYIHDEC